MENWWIEQNGASSPLSNVAPSNNIGVPNTVNYSRIWMPTTQSQPIYHGSTMYDRVSTFPSGLHTATFDTFIESFTQLTESISTNALYNHALSNNYPGMDNSAIYMANCRAITQYYNSRRIAMNRYFNPTASLNKNFRYLTPPQTAITNHSHTRTTTTNFYPNWKNYQTQSVNFSNLPTKKEDIKLPQAVKWNGSSNTNKSLNSSSSELFAAAEDLSYYGKNVKNNVEKQEKDSDQVQKYIDPKYDYINPHNCEFCKISDREPPQRSMELYDQCCLFRKIPSNPNELSDGIKKILSWPINKESNTLSDMDGLTAFHLDDHKRKMKELFPGIDFSGNKNNCVTHGCNCRQYAMSIVALQEPRPAASFVPSSGRHNFNDILKMSGDQSLFGKGQQYELTSSPPSTAEENTRRQPRPAASFVPSPGRYNFNDILKMSGDQTLFGKGQQYESTSSPSSTAEENARRQPRPAASFVPSSERHNFNDILKMSGDQSLFGKGEPYGSTSSPSSTAEENARRRVAELVCLGPLSDKLYMKLLNGTKNRSRMAYTNNFRNVAGNAAGGDAEKLSYASDRVSQEKLQELFLREAQMKSRNKM